MRAQAKISMNSNERACVCSGECVRVRNGRREGWWVGSACVLGFGVFTKARELKVAGGEVVVDAEVPP